MNSLARVPGLVVRRRGALGRAALTASVALPVVFVAAGLMVEDWRARRFLLAYVAPFFVALPLWVRCKVAGTERWSGREMALDAAVVTLGALRFAGGFLPFSGHMLFFVYSLLTERNAWYRALAVLLIAETTYFKLVVWRDPRSFILGAALGLASAAVHQRIAR